MKHYFFLAIVTLIVFAGIGWFGWMVLRALHTVFSDWRLGRELDELEAECAARRRERAAPAARRQNATTTQPSQPYPPPPEPAQPESPFSDFDITV